VVYVGVVYVGVVYVGVVYVGVVYVGVVYVGVVPPISKQGGLLPQQGTQSRAACACGGE